MDSMLSCIKVQKEKEEKKARQETDPNWLAEQIRKKMPLWKRFIIDDTDDDVDGNLMILGMLIFIKTLPFPCLWHCCALVVVDKYQLVETWMKPQ